MGNGSAESAVSVEKLSENTEKAIKEFCRSEYCLIVAVENEINGLDTELAQLVESNANVNEKAEEALLNAQEAMLALEMSIGNIRERTKSSDEIVREMTRDIKQLDIAKRNLTSSITTLHHLHILLTGVDSLGTWVEKRDYSNIARQLPAILNVLQLFDGYKESEQIANLSARLDRLKTTLTLQLANDLKKSFQTGQLNDKVTEMCRVAAALEGNVKDNFCKWFIEQHLAEYVVLYADNEEGAWLDKIDERYKWYVRKLTDFERTGLSRVFPSDWDMGRRLTSEFCTVTRDVLYRMMTRRRQDLEWKLLGFAIQHTKMFETLLVKRFPNREGAVSFEKSIWSVFDSFLDVFLGAQERTLNDFLETCASKIKSGEERSTREATAHAIPFPSSADMFLLLKKVITESSKLSSEPDALLRDVVGVLRVCLRGYAQTCLTAFLPTVGGASAQQTSTLFSLIREEATHVPLTADQQFLTCCILATADWCAETSLQLQEKLAQRVPGVDVSQETEAFYGITNQSLNVLVQDVEASCEAALQSISKVNWSAVDGVGDESPFIGAIRSHLRNAIPMLRDMLSDRRKYFAHFCLKLATQLAHKFVGALFRCRAINTHGAEQLLLDTHALKTFLLNMPSIDSAISSKPPTAYVTSVNAALNKAEMILKVVMSSLDTVEDFVEQYTKLLPTSDVTEMQKVLEMKGVKRQDHPSIIHTFRQKMGDSTSVDTAMNPTTNSLTSRFVGGAMTNVGSASSMSEAFSAVVSMAADGLDSSSVSSSIDKLKRLEKLVKRTL
ncbi:unnamed protein product [Caenorhabditis auriculariae]|uniref:Vacuolar protein sorting-associated protein 53 homolog n=1 Tax=Caenorhabditis auriculariae TaxID=2777116 RepID=A0A8S1GNZ2_9PELO|nr:unnamed protein product [Caenorhabditis auriculariae]